MCVCSTALNRLSSREEDNEQAAAAAAALCAHAEHTTNL